MILRLQTFPKGGPFNVVLFVNPQPPLIRKLDLLLPAPRGNILGQMEARGGNRFRLRLAGLIEEQGLADVLDLGDGALQVEGFGEDDLEDL